MNKFYYLISTLFYNSTYNIPRQNLHPTSPSIHLDPNHPTLRVTNAGLGLSLYNKTDNFNILSASLFTTCYISINKKNKLFCWGDNESSHEMLEIPIIFNSDVFNVSVGPHHMCAIRGIDQLDNFGVPGDQVNKREFQYSYCWGNNIYGELDVDQGNVILDQKVGQGQTCMLFLNFELSYEREYDCSIECQGKFVHPEGKIEDTIKIPADLENSFSSVTSGFSHLLITKHSDSKMTMVCLGTNTYGECTLPSGDLLPKPTISLVISAGKQHSCLLDDSYFVLCWGNNNFNQLHIDKKQFRNVFYSLHSGFEHNCATTAYGQQCWGRNDHFQASGSVHSEVNIVVFELGGHHNCVTQNKNKRGFDTMQSLGKNDLLTCWGQNHYGQCQVPERFRP